MNNTLIRWYSIQQAAALTGLSEDYIRLEIKKKRLKAKNFGDNFKITDLELNRFSLDLQYPRETGEKIRATQLYPQVINPEQNDFINSITQELIK